MIQGVKSYVTRRVAAWEEYLILNLRQEGRLPGGSESQGEANRTNGLVQRRPEK